MAQSRLADQVDRWLCQHLLKLVSRFNVGRPAHQHDSRPIRFSHPSGELYKIPGGPYFFWDSRSDAKGDQQLVRRNGVRLQHLVAESTVSVFQPKLQRVRFNPPAPEANQLTNT